jgi:Flp pilus assembly pilin Flp
MRKGQSALEYMILVIIIAGALLTMQVYIKRGLSGSWRRSIDDVGEQYEPKKTVSDTTYSLSSNTISNIVLEGNLEACESGGCNTNRLDYTNSIETKIGTENIAGY